MAQATQAELNKFVKVVDEFMAKYAQLIKPETRSRVYATNNAALVSDYETAVSRGAALKATIERTVGAWNAAKLAYAKVTDKSSMVIGDAIDEIRSWFGYDPSSGLGCAQGLGAIQLPAAAIGAVWIAGIIASATVLISAFNKIFVTLEANKIQKENPNVSRPDALRQATDNLPGIFDGGIPWTMLAVGALALYAISR